MKTYRPDILFQAFFKVFTLPNELFFLGEVVNFAAYFELRLLQTLSEDKDVAIL